MITDDLSSKNGNNFYSDTEITVNQRLKIFIEYLKLSQTKFGEKLGISKSMISQITKGISTLTTDNIIKISKIYPELNINWLIKGTGSMLNEVDNDEKFERLYTKILDQFIKRDRKIEMLVEEINELKKYPRGDDNSGCKNQSTGT